MIYIITAVCIMAVIGVPYAIWYEKAKNDLENERGDE